MQTPLTIQNVLLERLAYLLNEVAGQLDSQVRIRICLLLALFLRQVCDELMKDRRILARKRT